VFKDFGNYSEWLKVADAVIEATVGLDHGVGHLADMPTQSWRDARCSA